MEKKEVFRSDQEDYVDVKQLLQNYFRYWYFFVLGLLLCVGGAFCYLYVATPQYRVSSTILLKSDENQTGGGPRGAEPTALTLFNTKQNIDNELEVLNSKSLMQRVFSELSLVGYLSR